MDTLVHRRVAATRRGENPTAICKVESGWVVLGDNQILTGYCLLLPDPVVDDLNALSEFGRNQFCSDMIHIGDALLEVTESYRINYAILGNLDPALHAHITPRYQDEADERRRSYGSYEQDTPVPFDLERDRPLMDRIRDSLVRQRSCVE